MFHKVSHLLREEYTHIKPMTIPSLSLFIFYIGWGVIGPFFTINAKNILQDAVLIGFFMSLWGFIRFFTDFFVGALVDISDAKKMVSISFLSYFFIGFGYYFADTIPSIMFVRVLHSLCGSFLWVGVWGYMHKIIPSKYREENLTFEMIMRSTPSVFAPFFGAIIFTLSNPKNVFIVMSFASAIAFVLFLLRSTPVKVKQEMKVNEILQKDITYLKKFKNKIVFIGLLFVGIFCISGAYDTFMPIYLFEEGYSSTIIALIAVTTSIPIFFMLPVGIFADKIGRKPVLWWGLILLGVSLIGIYTASNIPGFLISVFLLGFSFAVVAPTANAMVGDMAVDGEQGAIAGVAEMFKDLGALSGPFIAGLMIEQFNFKTMILMLVVIVLLLLMLTKRFGNHTQEIINS